MPEPSSVTIHLPVEVADRLLTERGWTVVSDGPDDTAVAFIRPGGKSPGEGRFGTDYLWQRDEALTEALSQPESPRILAPGEHIEVVIGCCLVAVHAQRDAAGDDFLQLIGLDCNLSGEEPGIYYVEKFTPPHERRGGNGAPR